MLMLTGTLPINGLDVHIGEGTVMDGKIAIGNQVFSINRGTGAMIAACCAVCKKYDLPQPLCVVSGDVGRGEGSTRLYRYLRDNLPQIMPQAIALHYIMPNWYYHDEVLNTIKSLKKNPVLIADAGFMYVAKMSGAAPYYDIFTPDLGELAFLADGEAPHPFYTRGFIFHMEDRVEELIKMAHQEENAAKFLLVKGEKDYICKDGEVLSVVDSPNVPELEAIGGTGDTITGMLAALIYKGFSKEKALQISAKANRIAGKLIHPNPAAQIREIIKKISEALDYAQKIY